LLTVNKAAPRGTQPERAPRTFEPAFRIYAGNLPWDVDNERLEQVFDRETGRSRGFGFVKMSSETEMNDAIAALDGQVYTFFPSLITVSCFIQYWALNAELHLIKLSYAVSFI